MDALFQIAMTAFSCAGFGWLTFLIGKHGWAWVSAKLKARAAAAEAELKQKLSPALGDLEAHIRDIVHSEMAHIESDIAALKAKVGGLA